ncbi:hypothetical protein LINPERPRIM_LOCUS29075 [Linum perenne]
MEMVAASSPSAPTLRTVSIHSTTSVTHRHSTFFNNPTKRPNFYAVQRSSQTNALTLLPRCSTKPDTSTADDNWTADEQEQPNPAPIPEQEEDPLKKNGDVSLPTSSSPLSLPCSSRGLVFDLGTSGSWDSAEIGSPVVKRFLSDDEERWLMWYHGNSGENPGSDSLGLAISNNGVHWDRGSGPVSSAGDVGLVMSCGQDWWSFDTVSIRPGEVVVMSSSKVKASSAVYWLYYTGFSSEKVDSLLENGGEMFRSLPGLAISQDGRHWARIEGDHHSGALFDVGTDGEWDSQFIASPQVVFHGSGDLRMYYHSFDAESKQLCIGMARSRDGIKWVKLGKILGGGKAGSFDEVGVMNASVMRNKRDGNYMMAYEGVSIGGEKSIGMAVSGDGLRGWERVQGDDAIVLRGLEEDGSWDCEGVGCPCLVHMDGEADEWRLYYCGFGKEGRTGIGMAVSHGNDISCFRKWTGFPL